MKAWFNLLPTWAQVVIALISISVGLQAAVLVVWGVFAGIAGLADACSSKRAKHA